jgi:repressor LexA
VVRDYDYDYDRRLRWAFGTPKKLVDFHLIFTYNRLGRRNPGPAGRKIKKAGARGIEPRRSIMSLTPRQKEILAFIQGFVDRHGYSPSLEEIGAHFGFASPNAAFKHLQALEKRGFIRRRQVHAARAIELVPPEESGAGAALLELPLLGAIAAGAPIEALENVETIHVPSDFAGRGSHYVLRVRGRSMIDEHIEDGDFVIVQEAAGADNGDLVVALLDGENATLKRFYREKDGRVRLQPANPEIAPLVVSEDRLRIRGIVVGVMRKYR